MLPPPDVTTLNVPPVGVAVNAEVALGHILDGGLNVRLGNELTVILTVVSWLQPEVVTAYFNWIVPEADAVKVLPLKDPPPETTENVPPDGVPVKDLVPFTHIGVIALVITAVGFAVGVIVPVIVFGQLVPDTPGCAYCTTIAVVPDAVNTPELELIDPGPDTIDHVPPDGVADAVTELPTHSVELLNDTAPIVTKGLTVIGCVVLLEHVVVASV
jgi:hypothetical protein